MKSLLSKLLVFCLFFLALPNNVEAQYARSLRPDYIPRIQYVYFTSFDAENTLSGIGIESRAVYKDLVTGRFSINYLKDGQSDADLLMLGLLLDIPINSEPDRTGYYFTVGLNTLFDFPEGGETTVTIGGGVPRLASDEPEGIEGPQISPQLGFGGQVMLLEDIIYIYANGNYLPSFDVDGLLFNVGIDIRLPD